MTGRTARLSVGAGGLVVAWIVAYWWMDSDPTIRFDRDDSASSERSSPPPLVSPSVMPDPVRVEAEPGVAPDANQPSTATTAEGTVQASEDVSPEPRVGPVETKFYTIQPGDLLSRIAQREYGSIRYTTFLYEHNRKRLGLASPDAIREGQVLEIPPLDDDRPAGGGNG